jgi:septal ring factor EnvC (AmiA/AmiB activator)
MDNEVMETLQVILQTVNNKFTELNDKMDKGFKEVKQDIEKLDKRITKVEIGQEKMHDNIKVLAEGVSSNTEKLAVLEDKIDDLSNKVDKHDIKIQVIEGGKYKVN